MAKDIRGRGKFYSVSCDAHRDLCAELEIEAVPHVVGYKGGEERGFVLKRTSSNKLDPEEVARVVDGVERVEVGTKWKEETGHYLDASASFLFALKTNFYPVEDNSLSLRDDVKEDLIEWMDLLYWSLPSQWELHNLINDIRQSYEKIAENPNNLKKVSFASVFYFLSRCIDRGESQARTAQVEHALQPRKRGRGLFLRTVETIPCSIHWCGGTALVRPGRSATNIHRARRHHGDKLCAQFFRLHSVRNHFRERPQELLLAALPPPVESLDEGFLSGCEVEWIGFVVVAASQRDQRDVDSRRSGWARGAGADKKRGDGGVLASS